MVSTMASSFLPPNAGRPNSQLCNDVLLVQMPIEVPAQWKKKIETKYPGIEIRSRVLRLELGLEANKIEPELWKGVTLACLYLTHPEELMSNVRFLQLTSAGVDRWIHHERYKSLDVAISTASGIHW